MKQDKTAIDEKGIKARKSENFSEWYVQTLIKSEFIDYSEVSGMYILRPSAYGVWQEIARVVDQKLKKSGVENVYFPIFIPEKFLAKEASHVKGFTPEVAWVTESGETKMKERLAVRPTSEAMMYPTYAKWIRSWRDLPLRYNQWNSVVRWEFKDPTPFLRTREFLWHEGHSVFATEKEAEEERDAILPMYLEVLKDYLALPGIVGRKSDKEKFAGAIASYSIEHILPNGYAIQGPAFHLDGQNFAKAYGIKFLDKEGGSSYGWQNTYAISTRNIGIMIMVHGDDKGLVIPPRLAYVQVVIVPIYKDETRGKVIEFAREVEKVLHENFRVKVDDRESYSPGFKFNEWEMKGVPLRVEVGPKEADANKVVIVRRDSGAKSDTDLGNLSQKVSAILDAIQQSLYKRAEEFMVKNIHSVKDYSEFKKVLADKGGIIHAPWCMGQACEDKIKEETGAKITNIPFNHCPLEPKCIYCGRRAKAMANFAKSY
ncbi:MAG: proline--tRNA ligase [Candidatus Micrarchaeota archaeon]|nr:proline--tRNA ligase [Candidatus Micrarchaeota archaeon]MDE1847543.1 proline--tRNA ligase [Candidatus Micrarchaeota archaeon]MDE1864260.1 proline--tRNA ligase [Candidatus Micrarchaeota archaeon]